MYIYHLITLFAYLFVLFLFTIFLFVIHLFRIILITIWYLFISGSLFRNHLFVIYLFTILYFAFIYFGFIISYLLIYNSLFRLYLFHLHSLVIKKKLPTLSSGERSVMRTTIYRGGNYLSTKNPYTLLCYWSLYFLSNNFGFFSNISLASPVNCLPWVDTSMKFNFCK